MKTYTLLLLILSSLLLGCGQNKSTSRLRVSTSFAASNGSFPGGMTLTGRNASGAVFSKFIPYAAGSANQFDITLPNGQWDFYVVAFPSAPTSTGAVCDTTSRALSGSDITIDLSPSSAKCSSSIFGAPAYYTGYFTNITVGTCGTLARDDAGTPLNAGDYANNWCSSANISSDMKGELPKAIRYTLVDIDINGAITDSAISTCETASVSNGHTTINYRLPTKVLPVRIDLYKDQSCDDTTPGKRTSSFFFREGLDSSYSFDHFMQPGGGGIQLYLPSSKLQKGYTPYSSIVPKITCDNSNRCIPTPGLPAGVDRIVSNGEAFVLTDSPGGLDCTAIASPTLNGTALLSTDYSCEDKDDVIMFRLHTLLPSSCLVSCPLVTNGFPLLNVRNGVDRSASIFNSILDIVGSYDLPAPAKYSFESIFSDHDGQVFGLADDIRSMLKADGPGGLFGQTTCAAAVGVKQVTFFEDSGFSTYQIEVKNVSLPIPLYLCTDNNLTPASCSSSFDKRMIVRRLVGSVFMTEHLMNFSCARKVGVLESQQSKNDNGDNRSERSYIGWNLNDQINQRIEFVKDETRFAGATGVVENKERSYQRFERTAGSVSDPSFSVQSIQYNLMKNSMTNFYDESAESFRASRTASFLFHAGQKSHRSGVAGDAVGAMFKIGSTGEKTFFKEHIDNTGSSPLHAAASTSGGDYITASSNYDGSKYDLSVRVKSGGTIYTFSVDANSTTPIRPRVAITAALRPVVVFMTDSAFPGTQKAYVLRFNGSDLRNQDGNLFTNSDPISTGAGAASGVDVIFNPANPAQFALLYGEVSGSDRRVGLVGYDGALWNPYQNLLLYIGGSSYPYYDVRGAVDGFSNLYIVGALNLGADAKLDSRKCSMSDMVAGTLTSCTTESFNGSTLTAQSQPPIRVFAPDDGSQGVFVFRTRNDMGTEGTVVNSANTQAALATYTSAQKQYSFTEPTCFDLSATLSQSSTPLTNMSCNLYLYKLAPTLGPAGTEFPTLKLLDPTIIGIGSFFLNAGTFTVQ